MKRSLFLFAILFVTVQVTLSQPKFSDYPVKKIFKGKPARVNLRSAQGARYYRTNLRLAAKAGPNFAGYYAIGLWGCGSPCLMPGMVDLRTGKVTWPPSPGMMVFDISFRVNSRLYIVNSREVLEKDFPEGPPKWIGGEWPPELFFLWNGKKFVEIHEKHKKGSGNIKTSAKTQKRGVKPVIDAKNSYSMRKIRIRREKSIFSDKNSYST